ncbi:MAG: C10 family peptidase [Phycisphaerales bacterium]
MRKSVQNIVVWNADNISEGTKVVFAAEGEDGMKGLGMMHVDGRRLFIVSVILAWLLSISAALAGPVDLAKATKATGAFLAGRSAQPGQGSSGSIRAQAAGVTPAGFRTVQDDDGTVLAYVADLDPCGFVALSADTDIAPVIAYSFNASFPASQDASNPLYRMLWADLHLRTKALMEHPELKTAQTAEQWDLLAGGETDDANDSSFQQWPSENTTSTGGLLETAWVQSEPYNAFCPKDPVDGVRSYVGCVATAFAQLVHYHKVCDVRFSQDDSYTTTSGIQIDADSELYDFLSFEMLNGYLDTIRLKYSQGADLSDTDIAALNFACGAAVEMDYSSNGSGATLYTVQTTLLDRFGYYSADMYGGLTRDALIALQENVINGLPALLSFSPPDNWGGHVVVCDGYNTDGEYHLNFGWGVTRPQEMTEAWYSLPTAFLYKDCIITESILNIRSARPQVEVDASSLSFYATPGGQSSPQVLRITNNVANLRIESISCPDGFAIDRAGNGYGMWIDSFLIETLGQGATINVVFQPTQAGGYYGTLVIRCEDDSTRTVILDGHAYEGGTTVAAGSVSGTWSADNSPYFVTGSIYIPAYGQLVIEPGVKVFFTGSYGLTVGQNARLLAEGSDAQPIEFTAWNRQTGWGGLRFLNSGYDDVLGHCLISYAKKELGLDPQDNSLVGVRPTELYGGAVYCLGSDLTIENCTIANNTGGMAGAVYCSVGSPLICNTVIANNTSIGGPYQCGGILCDSYGAPEIRNCTIVNNFPGGIYTSSGDTMNVINTILWGNDRYQIYTDQSVPTVVFCDVEGGYLGEGNFEADPCFLDPAEGVGTDYDGASANWALASDSPCINAGTRIGDLPATDLAGGDRVYSDVVDIGAYENQSELPLLTVTPSTAVDAGYVAVGGNATIAIELANTGRLELEIEDLQTADEAFSIATPIRNRLLSPGESVEVEIAFNPSEERVYTGTLLVHSTGSNASAMPIVLRGVGVMGTSVPAGSVSGTWRKTNSPYTVIGDISIPRGQTLTIEPGVTVKFAGHFSLTVGYRATLLARGTEDDGIVFTAIDTDEGWFGIRIVNSSTEDVLQHCTFEYAMKPRTGGGSFENLYGGAILSCGSYDYDPGVPQTTRPTIDSCVFTRNSAYGGGAIMCYGSEATITNNVIVDNSADGYGGAVVAWYADCTIANNVIARNSALAGGGIMNWRSAPAIRNNTIVANRPNAMQLETTLYPGWDVLAVPIQNNVIWQNEVWVAEDVVEGEYEIRYNNIQGGWDGTGNLDADPLFADAENGDYHLKSQAGRWEPGTAAWILDDVTSPCIDAGDPTTSYSKEPQPNGNRVNLGAYGGTDQASKSR